MNQHNIPLILLERYALAIICLLVVSTKSMFLPEIALDSTDIYLAPANQEDDVLFQSQGYWIAEAIRCTHRENYLRTVLLPKQNSQI